MCVAVPVASRAEQATWLPSSKTLIYLFFFVSGMPALAYQLIWQRVLFRVFGVNMESVTVVVTAFMLGLGIGSLIGSQLAARRFISPLLLIAIIEVSIGVFGVCSLGLFDLADHFVQELPLAAKAVTAIGLVFVPTALMGMTLPLLVGYLVRHSANVGLSTGGLYRVNTLGAAAGCMGSALALFPWIGLQASVWVAASLNFLVAGSALLAFLLQDKSGSDVRSEVAKAAVMVQPEKRLSQRTAFGLAFFGGFVSLSYEIFLVRLVSFASATNALALAVILAGFLLGIALGSQMAAEWSADGAACADLPARAARVLLFNGLFGLAILPILSACGFLGIGLLGVIEIAAIVVACSLGIIFPLVAHLAIAPDHRSGSRIGLLYLANILGSASGSLLTGFVLTDILGARSLAVILATLCFALSIPFIRLGARKVRPLALPLVSAGAAAAALIAFQPVLSARLFESLLYKAQSSISPPLARIVENRDGIIAVSPDGVVYGGGIYDGRFNTDIVHDTNGIIRPFALSLYHPAPRDVLMIGLASGSWAQVVASNPDVRRFTVVEINPGYIQLIRERPEVASLLTNPKVHIVIDDGRRWLKQHPELHFDAVLANTTYHFRANASNVLSSEFDDLIRAHLNRGGVFFFNTTDSLRVQRTGCESFRFGYRVTNHLLVSDLPFALDIGHWRQNLLATRIDGHGVFDLSRPADAAALRRVLSLAANANVNDADAPKRLMESCVSIRARTSGVRLITDDNMGTEWRQPLGLD